MGLGAKFGCFTLIKGGLTGNDSSQYLLMECLNLHALLYLVMHGEDHYEARAWEGS